MEELAGSPYKWTAVVDLMRSYGAISAIACFEFVKQLQLPIFLSLNILERRHKWGLDYGFFLWVRSNKRVRSEEQEKDW